MENSRNNPLGINKLGKSIRKSPLHQPSAYHNGPHQQQQPQPQVYNISKNDFRSIVQQLTGTPTRDPQPANPNPYPVGPSRPPPPRPNSSMRLQRIRPPPLTPIARPALNPVQPGPPPRAAGWARPAESPVSAYMRYLETSLLHSDGTRPSPRPRPGLLPSPGPPSPSSFLNLISPRSPYPLLSPGYQYPPPLTPNFSFSPLPPSQQGILGPGPAGPPSPLPPLSPGLFFPSSPSGFFPLMSPRWRDM